MKKWLWMFLAGVGAVAAALVLVNQETPRERALRELERFAPAAQPPACAPAGDLARPFAAALAADASTAAPIHNARARQAAIYYDCLHANAGAALQRLALVGGPLAAPFFAQVAERCPLESDNLRPSACGAVQALAASSKPGAPDAGNALAALASLAQKRTLPVEVWLGAQLRLWRRAAAEGKQASTDELSRALADAHEPYARAAVIALLRGRTDEPSLAALRRAREAETAPSVRAQLTAAILAGEHPGECVSEDEGRGTGGRCRYQCPGHPEPVFVERPPDALECPLTFSTDKLRNGLR